MTFPKRALTVLLLAIPAYAELPVAISVNTKAGTMFADGGLYGENEIVVEMEFDVLSGLCVGVENLLGGDLVPGVSLADEATLGISLSPVPVVSLGVAGELFGEESGVSYAVDGIVGLGYEWDSAGICIGDESEFVLHLPSTDLEYVNTLSVTKDFALSDTRSVCLALEHELVVTSGDAEGCALCGPGYCWRFICVYANYVLGWISEGVSHGAEGGIGLEF
jgi:hypothetical protein